jgi:hypothetical protein
MTSVYFILRRSYATRTSLNRLKYDIYRLNKVERIYMCVCYYYRLEGLAKMISEIQEMADDNI